MSTLARRQKFYEELSRSVAAGIPVVQALQTSERLLPPDFSQEVRQIHSALQSGSTLADACKRATKLFPGTTHLLMKIGEQTGKLPNILSDMAAEIAALRKIRTRLLILALYPTLILFVWLFLFPLLEGCMALIKSRITLESFNFSLELSRYIKTVLLRLFATTLIVVFILMLPKMIRNVLGEARWTACKFNLPIFGRLFRLHYDAVVAKHTALGLRSGLTIMDSLRMAADSTASVEIVQRAKQTLQEIQKGRAFFEALQISRLFPAESLNSIATAEQSGTLDQQLESMSTEWHNQLLRNMQILNASSGFVMLLITALFVVILAGLQYKRYLEMLLETIGKIQ